MTEPLPINILTIECGTDTAAARFIEQLNSEQADFPDCTIFQEGTGVVFSTPNRNKAVVLKTLLEKQGLSANLTPKL